MIQSSKPRKQREFRFNSSGLHVRQKFASAHIAKDLAKKLGIKRRAIEVRKGDTVKVMAGSNRGKIGKVSAVSLKRSKLFIEGIVRKNAKGKEHPIPIHVSSVYITDLDLNDKLRKARIEAFKTKV